MAYIRYGKSPLTACYPCYEIRHNQWKSIIEDNHDEKERLVTILKEKPQSFSELSGTYGKVKLRTLIRQLIRDGYRVIEKTIESGYEVSDTTVYITDENDKSESFQELNDVLQHIVTDDDTYDLLIDDILKTSFYVPLSDLFSNCTEVFFKSVYEAYFKGEQFIIRFYSVVDEAYEEPLSEVNLMQFLISEDDVFLRLYGQSFPDGDFVEIGEQFPSLSEDALERFRTTIDLIIESVL